MNRLSTSSLLSFKLFRYDHQEKSYEAADFSSTPRKSGPPMKRSSTQKTHSVVATDIAENDTDASTYTLFNGSCTHSKPYVITMQINGAELPMEVDNGASLTLISKATFDRLAYWVMIG